MTCTLTGGKHAAARFHAAPRRIISHGLIRKQTLTPFTSSNPLWERLHKMQNSFYEILGDQAAVNHFPFTVATRVSIPLRDATS
jgi:hypothetical protein